ncbi:MAG: efflux RND transporter permease subunit [Holosporaceae bacterium]|jgi:multidrug efflux pump|nr:efflux RND transporter permease subunit [Holosporaceae bacterium]
MQISELCIKRPVFSTVLTLMIVVLGIICQSKLQMRKDPRIEKSVIVVESEFPGASPKVVESQITRILEGEFATIPGLELIRSNSSNQKSEIVMEFVPERTPDGASSDVRDRLSMARNRLPHGIPEPIIRKGSSDSNASIYVGFTSERHTIDDLRDHVEKYVKSKFEVLPGVGHVVLSGGNVKTMRVYVNPQSLAAYGYTPSDVVETIMSQHIQRPCGRLISQDREFMLVANGELSKPEEFDEIVLPSNGRGKVVRIKDIGKSRLVAEDVRSGSWFNGKECVTLSITKQATANPVDLSNAVNKAIPDVREILPTGVSAVIAMDEAKDIKASLYNVYQAIFEATFLVVFVVFLFLWSFRATLIPIVTIPVSLLGTLILLFAFDFSINTFTLLAMVLAVGLVVDDAIVVLENIHRHMETGISRFKAAIIGSKEIFFSIVAMTLTLAIAYIPIALTPGKVGRYFREFALALAGAVLISGFVAVTLSPMMCSKLLSVDRKKNATGMFARAAVCQESILKFIESKYLSALTLAINKKAIVLLISAITAVIGIIMVNILPSESRPLEDTGFIGIHGNAPIGASYAFMENSAKRVNDALAKTPHLLNRWITADTSKIEGFVQLIDWKDRGMSSKEVAEKIHPMLKEVPGVPCSASSGFGGSDKDTVDFILQTNQSYEYLTKYGQKFLWSLQSNYEGIQHPLQSSLLPPQQEYVLDIDRNKTASLGVSVKDIVETVECFVKGTKAANVQRESNRDELFVQAEKKLRETTDDLTRMQVKSKMYSNDNEIKMVPISDLITVRDRSSPMGLNHHNQMLSIVAFGNIAKGYSLGGVVNDLVSLKDKYLPDTIQLTFSGETRNYLEESKQIALIFALALIFVFLVLAAQFESFIDPFIIMLSVPFSITGALITLYIFPEGSLNIYSKVGLVTLIGLITKHGILIVDFANKLRESGKKLIESVLEAAFLRLRPILMTTFAMVIGSIPLAMASGAGASARRQIGLVIVGGMTFGTFFTLFIVPIFYVLLSRTVKKRNEDEIDEKLVRE